MCYTSYIFSSIFALNCVSKSKPWGKGRQSHARRRQKGSTEKSVFEIRIRTWLGVGIWEDWLESTLRKKDSICRDKRHKRVGHVWRSSLLIQYYQNIKATWGMAKLRFNKQAKRRFSPFPPTIHIVHSSSVMHIIQNMFCINVRGEWLDMAKSILHFRQITLDGLNTSQQSQRKIFKAPKTI